MLCFDDRWLEKQSLKPSDIRGFVHAAGQPTCHFKILRERGLDKRRVIIDETASRIRRKGTAQGNERQALRLRGRQRRKRRQRIRKDRKSLYFGKQVICLHPAKRRGVFTLALFYGIKLAK